MNFEDERIVLINPDTDETEKCVVTGRAGKAGAANRNWFNVRNLQNDVNKSVDFSRVQEWYTIPVEVLYNANENSEISAAKNDEFEKWRQYEAYEEVEDQGQSAISTRWVITMK